MKIKKICRLLSLLCLLTDGILFQTQPVKAVQAGQQSYDSDKKGSIQVCLDDIGTDRSLVSLYCYKVGSPKLYENNLEGWTVQETFESLNLDFNHLGDTEVHRESARKLVAFIEENGKIRPVQTGVTDKNGECIFSALPQGVYLIVQKDSFDDYGTTEPFLMTVPYIEDDMVIYDVVTQTKGEKPVPPTETETETQTGTETETGTETPGTNPGTPDNKPGKPAKTGDDKPIAIVAAAALISAVGIGLIVWKKSKKENDGK